MEIVKEIVVFLENRPGVLARITQALSEQKVNILGFTILNSVDHAALRMVVSKPEVALHMLGEHGMLTFENDVLFVELANKAGALMDLAGALAKKRINIDYAYGSAGKGRRKSGFYLRVSNTKRAFTLLSNVPGIE